MSRKRKPGKPANPMDIARRRAEERAREREPANWGLAEQSLSLAVNAAVDTRLDAAGRVVRARRQDVFDMLLSRGRLTSGALGAVRRLQDDIACLHRTALGGVDYLPRVDRSP